MIKFNSEIVTLIRGQASEMEQSGTLTSQVLNYIYENGLFKLFVPRKLGGNMTPLPEALRVFEQASWIEGSFGWLINIGSGGGFFASSIDPKVSQQIYTGQDAVIAGSGNPAGRARKVDGGYMVSGQWSYCSGATHATVFTANCVIEQDHEANPKIRSFILLPDQVKVIKDWVAFGLKATASHTITVKNRFVPDERTFDLFDDQHHFEDPIFRYPFLQFAEASFTAVCVGIGRHFLEEAQAILQQRHETKPSSDKAQFTMDKMADLEQFFSHSVDRFYEKIAQSWERHLNHEPLADHDLEQVSRQCKETARIASYCAQSIFPYLGIHAVMEDAPINKIWRDLHTACQHTMLVPYHEIDVISRMRGL